MSDRDRLHAVLTTERVTAEALREEQARMVELNSVLGELVVELLASGDGGLTIEHDDMTTLWTVRVLTPDVFQDFTGDTLEDAIGIALDGLGWR